MDKKTVIEKVNAAIARVMKASGGAIAAAISVAVEKLNELAATATSTEGIDWSKLWSGIDEACRILYTVQSGYPMVPAELIAKADKKLPAEEFMVYAAAELEKAAASLADGDAKAALPRVAAVKASLQAWEGLPADAPVPVIAAAAPATNPPAASSAAAGARGAVITAAVAAAGARVEKTETDHGTVFSWPRDMAAKAKPAPAAAK